MERFFSTITTRRIRRGTFESVPALEAAIHDYLAHYKRALYAARLDRDGRCHLQGQPILPMNFGDTTLV